MKEVTLQLAQYKPLIQWRPQIGDTIIQHGLLTHWFGIVNGINGNILTVVKAGLPILLLTIDELSIPKNQIEITTQKIATSRNGKFAVLQNIAGNNIWYVG